MYNVLKIPFVLSICINVKVNKNLEIPPKGILSVEGGG
jgi:hypothetical protein